MASHETRHVRRVRLFAQKAALSDHEANRRDRRGSGAAPQRPRGGAGSQGAMRTQSFDHNAGVSPHDSSTPLCRGPGGRPPTPPMLTRTYKVFDESRESRIARLSAGKTFSFDDTVQLHCPPGLNLRGSAGTTRVAPPGYDERGDRGHVSRSRSVAAGGAPERPALGESRRPHGTSNAPDADVEIQRLAPSI